MCAVDPGHEEPAQLHKSIGDEGGFRAVGAIFRMGVGDIAEIFECAERADFDAISCRIHTTQLPLRHGAALTCCKLQRIDSGFLVSSAIGLESETECLHRCCGFLTSQFCDVKGENRRRRETAQQDKRYKSDPDDSVKYPHRYSSQLSRPDV